MQENTNKIPLKSDGLTGYTAELTAGKSKPGPAAALTGVRRAI